MQKTKAFLAALALAASLLAPGLTAAGHAQETATAPQPDPPKEPQWSFSGPFGTYDRAQLRRGFEVFKTVCAACHSADELAFRNLAEPGGPDYAIDKVKELAAQYYVPDPDAKDGERTARPSDHWPSPFASQKDARDANNGAYPPDLSVMAKAHAIAKPFPAWLIDAATGDQDGGADFIYNVLTSYHDEPPKGVKLSDTEYYVGFLGAGLAMPPPLFDGIVDYDDPKVPQTVDQYARDVSAFLSWLSDPHMQARKKLGFQVVLVLIVLAGLAYLSKRRVWSKIEH